MIGAAMKNYMEENHAVRARY